MFQARAASSSSPGSGLRQEQRASIVVRADADVVQSQEAPAAARSFRPLARRVTGAARDVRLVGDQDQRESRFAQAAAGFANAGQQPQLGERGGRVRFALAGGWRGSPRRRDPGKRRGAWLKPPQPRVGQHGLQRRRRAPGACSACRSSPGCGCDPYSGERRARRPSSRDRRRCIRGGPGLRTSPALRWRAGRSR